MADHEKTKPDGRPESPTTARELDFDDDEGPVTPAKTGTQPPAAPAQVPKPVDPRLEAENTLKEAFPTIDAAVVRAVLMASGGQVEPAFNALLGMSDPDALQREPPPPPQPPRPTQTQTQTTRSAGPRSQLEADELYARQLAEHYAGQSEYDSPRRDSSRDYRGQVPRLTRPARQQTGLKPNELYDDRERTFIDDDLPEIRENIRKGFIETQSKVSSFITSLRKKLDGEDEEEEPPPQPPRRGQSSQQQYGSRRSTELGRRSGDRERYDADPQVLGDDFAGLHMQDNTPQRTAKRPGANPDLFKPTPDTPGSGRRVSFQEGPPEEIGRSRTSREPTPQPSSTNSKSKWQPLAPVDPSPIGDHDPFSVGDSDEDESKKKDVKSEDSERLKSMTAAAMAEDIGSGSKKASKPAEKSGSGTSDKEAEEKLTGKP